MDPVELFRLRCLREAEEKFRQGVLSLKSEPKREVGQKMVFDECCEGLGVVGGKEDGMKNEPSLQGSQSSFVSVPEPLVELFVPRPPPGPTTTFASESVCCGMWEYCRECLPPTSCVATISAFDH